MKVNCPWCGQPCEIDGTMIGGDAQCPYCGKEFLVREEDIYDRQTPQNDAGAAPAAPSSYVEETRTTLKPLSCEMCGSNDILKRDGVFVCQSCGTKYSVEEARKMMASGTVKVAGTVKVDQSEKLRNLYQIARRAKEENNEENAARYYDLILQEDPESWEASFYLVYFKAKGSNVANIVQAAQSINNCLDNVFALIRRHCTPEEALANMEEVADRVMKFFALPVFTQCKLVKCQAYYALGDAIERHLSDFLKSKTEMHFVMTMAWKCGILLQKDAIWNCAMTFDRQAKSAQMQIFHEYVQKVRRIDPHYRPPVIRTWTAICCGVLMMLGFLLILLLKARASS